MRDTDWALAGHKARPRSRAIDAPLPPSPPLLILLPLYAYHKQLPATAPFPLALLFHDLTTPQGSGTILRRPPRRAAYACMLSTERPARTHPPCASKSQTALLV